MTLDEIKMALHGQYDDQLDRLAEPLTLLAFTDLRSATVALEACKRLANGNITATIKWMNHPIIWDGRTPLEMSEESVEGMQLMLDDIGRIEAGVFF